MYEVEIKIVLSKVDNGYVFNMSTSGYDIEENVIKVTNTPESVRLLAEEHVNNVVTLMEEVPIKEEKKKEQDKVSLYWDDITEKGEEPNFKG